MPKLLKVPVGMPEAGRTTVSIMGACTLCKVTRRTIYNWINAGKLTIFRTPGGAVRLYEDELLRSGRERQRWSATKGNPDPLGVGIVVPPMPPGGGVQD